MYNVVNSITLFFPLGCHIFCRLKKNNFVHKIQPLEKLVKILHYMAFIDHANKPY